MRKAKFKIESLDYETFDGFTKDENWNGSASPYFIFEQARKVLKNYNQLRQIIGQNNLAQYDSTADAFIFPFAKQETETFAPIVENGQKFYPIGAFMWIWEEENK